MSEERLRQQARLHLERLAVDGLWGMARPAPSAAGPVDAAPAGRDESPDSASSGPPERLADIEPEALSCTACRLCETRTNVVFGVGDPDARVMFIGEGPGRDEDLRGEPFVGAAGRLLDKIIAAMGFNRERVYIANTVKCRPPRNRDPQPDELAACRHFLERQVAAIRPEVIVLLGRIAAQAVLDTEAPLGRLRGRFHDWCGIPVICTYHPAYLLRSPGEKRKTWEDIQKVMARLDAGRQ